MSFNTYPNIGNGMIPPPPNPPLLVGGPQAPPSALASMPPVADQQQHAFQQMQQLQQHYQQQMQQLQQCMNPAMNDTPLDFNLNKNKAPMGVVREQNVNGKELMRGEDDGDRRDRHDRRDRRHGRDRRERRDRDGSEGKSNSLDGCESSNHQGMANTMSMMPLGDMMSGMMGSMVGPGIMPLMDPSAMLGMGQFGMMPGMMPEGDGSVPPLGNIMGQESGVYQQRTILQFKECTLVPPSPHAPPSATRERPGGCRTVYVGGLPDNVTEEIIRDVFGRCGEMISVRLSKKNFCHIRFELEVSVDAAMLYSGYRMRIGNKADAVNTGRLHVDYAQARVDQYEYECKQRALLREQRHRERVERDRMRPVSPPPIPHYSDHEAGNVAESMKNDEGFKKSTATVVAWLERGDLSKRNANIFYSMLQSTYSHVRRLLNEKMQYEEELRTAKDHHRTRVMAIITQFESIEKVFTSAAHKKCWDHFTKAQRKNIEMWKKQSLEIKTLQFDDSNEVGDEEMDVSDEDESGPQKKRSKTDVNALKDENDALKCQLEAYKNEVDMVKADIMVDIDDRDKKILVLQQTIQNLSNELASSAKKLLQEQDLVKTLQQKIRSEDDIVEVDSAINNRKDCAAIQHDTLSENDAKLIGLISTFLHVHPFGAGLDYIWSYLSKLDASVKVNDVEALMAKVPTVFRQELCGIGATLERRWIFIGFSGTKDKN